MARVKVDLPDKFIFSTTVDVFMQHINYGRHLDNAALLSLVGEARVRFFQRLGFADELQVDGVGMILCDLAMQYRAEIFHGDRLTVDLALADDNRRGFDLCWRVSSKRLGKEAARGKHGVMFMDYQTHKVVDVPPLFNERLQDFLSEVSL